MKKIFIISGIILAILILAIIVVVKLTFSKGNQAEEIIPTPTIALPTVSDKISIDLIPQAQNQSVMLKISGLTKDMESVEYELTYITSNNLPRGVLGKIKLSGEKEITRSDIVLGTCSSGKCVYDTGVTSVNLSLKFNTISGSQIFQKTYSL